MEIQFLGGASEVGRSAIFIKDDKRILLDYGIKINEKTEFPMQAAGVDIAVLSHAHLDHSGFIPSLFFANYPVTITTEPTAQLSELLIKDSMKINRKQHMKQSYFNKQLEIFMNRYLKYEYGVPIENNGYYISLYDAGHITGSAVTLIEKIKNDKRIVYTGDFKIDPQILQGSADIVESNVLIIESTYANREHPNRSELIKKFVEGIKEVLDNNGTALVPSFAVGRAQEILAILYMNKLIDYTYIDGMAKAASEIVINYPEFTRNKDILMGALKNVNWIGMHADRSEPLRKPSIIVTTAGMLNGGPALNYITRLNENSKIFLTGYQVEGTNGRRMMEGKPIKINARKFKVNTPWEFFDFSAHAGKSDLFEYVRRSNPEKVICVHGDAENTKLFADTLKMEGFEAYAPKVGEKIKIDL
ncbi:MAG: MBL fold metallo-hydrolase [Candidatus Micrarchaeia archaeon]